jgi:ABC-type glycerol-3-phosphate transport system substrate-binding protein
MWRRVMVVAGGILLAAVVSACASGTPVAIESQRRLEPTIAAETASPETLVSSRGADGALLEQAAQATPTPQPTRDPLRIQLWWPDELYPKPDSDAERVLLNQFDGFRQTYATYNLDVRRKRATGLGGILPTLRTALPVAPRAVPDLTLMRRTDMLAAATEGLIVPLEDWLPTDILNGLVPGTRALGEIDGTLYGLPYVLNIYHVVYRSSVFDAPLLTFDDVLEQGPEYLFPAGAGAGTLVSWTVLLQYLAAGGTLVDAGGNPALDRNALLTVMTYYEQAVADGIFDPALLDFTQFDVYWDAFQAGEANMVMVDTTTYFKRREDVPNVGLAPVPTHNGEPLTALDGWMWVLTTQDPDHQRQARAFLSWMMRINQHSTFTEALGMLPSQLGALRLWDDSEYAGFAQDLLATALIIPAAQRNNAAAVALEGALAAVLAGTPAVQAADDALETLD